MAITNQERVGKALDLLRDGLAAWPTAGRGDVSTTFEVSVSQGPISAKVSFTKGHLWAMLRA